MAQHCSTLLLLLLIHGFSRPGFTQSNAMALASLPPPTSVARAASPTSISGDSAASASPSILYPTGDPVINNIDTLILSYNAPWDVVRLAVFCGEIDATGQILYSFTVDNVPKKGPYDISPVQQSMDPQRYPIYCHLMLEDPTNAENFVSNDGFVMTSTGGSPSRYALSTTVAVAAVSGSGTTTSNAGSASSPSDSSAQSGTNTSLSNPTADPASSSQSSSSSSTSALSSGAKGGIAIAVIASLALLALFLFCLLRYRRRLRHAESALEMVKADAAAQAAQHASEKAYLDSILTAAGKPDTAHGGKIVIANLGHRQSGDWRQFFASKANSARQAISSVGSRGNSKASSRRASRLPSRSGTAGADEVPLPSLPSLPSPSLDGSMRGEGSTVGLVSGSERRK